MRGGKNWEIKVLRLTNTKFEARFENVSKKTSGIFKERIVFIEFDGASGTRQQIFSD